jgi:hypothetical protein
MHKTPALGDHWISKKKYFRTTNIEAAKVPQ